MILVKNWKFLSSVLFFEQGLDMCCYEKEGFLDYKVSFSQKSVKKFTFFQSLVKNSKFLSNQFFFEKGLKDMYFHDVVCRKGSFLDYKNVIFYIVDKFAFFYLS